MRVLRGLLAGWLLAMGLGLVPLGDLALWVRRELLDTDRFRALSVRVIEEPDVRSALAARVTDDLITQQPALAAARPALKQAAQSVIATTTFRAIFEHAVGQMHAQLVNGDDRLSLDLDPMLPLVQRAVALVDGRAAALVPTSGIPPVDVATKSDAPALWDGIDVARTASWALPLAALLVLIAAIVVSRRPVTMAIAAGLAVAVVAAAILVVLGIARRVIADAAGSAVDTSAFDAGWHAVTSTLVNQTIVLGLLGLTLAAVGVVWRLVNRRPAVAARRDDQRFAGSRSSAGAGG